jgi:hypothetical protein
MMLRNFVDIALFVMNLNYTMAKEEHGCDSGSESLDKHDTCDILHCHDQIFAVAERAER